MSQDNSTTNGSSGTTSAQTPIPVPANMRTSRRLPRIVAAIITLVWLATFTLGISKLESQQAKIVSPLDNFLAVGAQSWGIVATNDTARCLGYIESELIDSSKPELVLNGLVHFQMHRQLVPVRLSLNAAFESFLKLDSLRILANLKDSSLNIETDPDDTKALDISIITPNTQKQFSVTRPEPVFLTKRSAGRYHLRLPSEYEFLLQHSENGMSSISNFSGLSLQTLDGDAMASCKKQAANTALSDLPKTINVDSLLDSFTLGNETLALGKLLMGNSSND